MGPTDRQRTRRPWPSSASLPKAAPLVLAVPPASAPDSASPLRFLLLIAGPLLLIAAVGLLLRRRSQLRDFTRPSAIPRTVFAAVRRADEAAVRERAAEEVVRLAGSTRSAAAAPDATERAREACATAEALLQSAAGVPDLAGVFALLHEGHTALDRSAPPLPLCFFHPLHGPATRHIPWHRPENDERLQVAACTTCIRFLRAGRTPDTLTDQHEGHSVPYYAAPPEHSVWSATGYGSLLTTDSLTAHVRRHLKTPAPPTEQPLPPPAAP
ncbi:hypothetical protein [Streptomyces sp. NPDC052496]|uniref:hypothetical protein n=1 Tax=Streptomyces sp. NPDC052496 TaxID=3154951 RepID=UPI003445C589